MYKSCHIVQHGLCFFNEAIASCCFSPANKTYGRLPMLLFDKYKGEIISKEELFKTMGQYINEFKQGGCPEDCETCYHIEERDWDEGQYLDYLTITHFSKCNADCIYCTNNQTRDERTNDTYDILPVLKSFKEQGIIKEKCELHIGGGEFTIYKECDELLELFAVSNYARVFVPTNAIKYSHTLFRAMDEATTYIIVSLDCGSREMYKKIKRVDAFDQVMASLEKYAATQKSKDAIRLKYIIIPTINDNMSEFKKFLKIAKHLGVQNLIIDLDARYSRITGYKIAPYLIELAEKMNKLAIKQNFITEFYSFLLQDINDLKKEKPNFIRDIINRLHLKYYDKEVQELYLHQLYGEKRKQKEECCNQE